MSEVTINNVTIGDDSESGLAFKVTFEDGEVAWVPYSQCSKRTKTTFKSGDSFTVPLWLAEKNGWA